MMYCFNKNSSELKKKIFFFMATLAAYGSSHARDWIQAATVTYAPAVATPDPLTHCAGQGSNWHFCSNPSCCSLILNPLCHSRNFQTLYCWVIISRGKTRKFPWYSGLRIQHCGSSHHGSAKANLTSTDENASSIPGLAQWGKDSAFSRAVE